VLLKAPTMMIVGRLFVGFASGINISIIPVYISEISVPVTRGIMVGVQGTSIGEMDSSTPSDIYVVCGTDAASSLLCG
jgi:MFS family permease